MHSLWKCTIYLPTSSERYNLIVLLYSQSHITRKTTLLQDLVKKAVVKTNSSQRSTPPPQNNRLIVYSQGRFQKNNMGSSFVGVVTTPSKPLTCS